MMPPKLGLIAGNGTLPQRVIEAAHAAGREVFVVALEGHCTLDLSNLPHHKARLGAAGEIMAVLKQAGCTDLIMAGGVRRPSLVELRPDWRATKFFAKAGFALLGDDGLLKAVKAEFESEGFRLIAPQDIATDILTPHGCLTLHTPSQSAYTDIDKGRAVLEALAPLDIGQAVIVQQGLVLGIEAIEGTAMLIERCKAYHRAGQGGVLVKLSKPQQAQNLDLPTVGLETIQQAAAAGLQGIVLEAGRSILLNRVECVAAANAAGLFLLGLERPL